MYLFGGCEFHTKSCSSRTSTPNPMSHNIREYDFFLSKLRKWKKTRHAIKSDGNKVVQKIVDERIN